MLIETIVIILIILIGAIFIIVPGLIAIYYFEGSLGSNYGAKGYIKLKTLKSFYEINPDRWTLYDDHIKFNISNWSGDAYCFHFIDYYRYKLWYHKIKKYNSQLETNKAYAEMIKIIKQDIADFEKRNAAETKQKLNEIWKEK